MKQLGSIIDWGHPGQPPAAIMSRFLPKLFLRRAETDISTISRLQAGKFLPSGIQDPPTQRCLQLCPQIVPNYSEGGGETQSLYFAFKGGRAFTIKDPSALWIFKRAGMEFVWRRRSILSESVDGTQYTTTQLFGHCPPTKEAKGRVGSCLLPLQPHNLLSDVHPINPLGKPHKPP